MSWSDPLPASFCEGKLYPYLIPHIYEVFNSFSGLILIVISVSGIMLQPRLDLTLQLMYGGLFVSGVGTFLLHFDRIQVFNLADVFPLLITLAIGLIAFFDELIRTWRRRQTPTTLKEVERLDRIQSGLLMTSISGWLCYLVAGLLLIIYPPIKEIFGLYFGIPFGITEIVGMAFLYLNRRAELRASSKEGTEEDPRQRRLFHLMLITLFTGFSAIFFKVIDASLCNPITVWLFPHALFHILITYTTHASIVFIAFYRATAQGTPGSLEEQQQQQQQEIEVRWFGKIFPYLYVPATQPPRRFTSSTSSCPLIESESSANVIPMVTAQG